jgi:hypothetical protein
MHQKHQKHQMHQSSISAGVNCMIHTAGLHDELEIPL